MSENEAEIGIYTERAFLVSVLICVAVRNGIQCSWWVDPEAGEEWPVVCIDLPTGQVTWHMSRADFVELGFDQLPESAYRYDGHTVAEKYERLVSYRWGIGLAQNGGEG